MKGSKGINRSIFLPRKCRHGTRVTLYPVTTQVSNILHSSPRRPARSQLLGRPIKSWGTPQEIWSRPLIIPLLRLESSCVDDPGEPSHFVPSSRTFSNYEHSPPLQGWCVEGRREYLRANGYRHCPYHRLKYLHPSPRPINLKTYQSADVCDHHLQDAQHTAALGVEQVT